MRKYLLFGLVVLLAGCGAERPPAAAPSPAPPPSSVPTAVPVEVSKDLATYVAADADLAAAHLKAEHEPTSYFISTNTPLVLLSACGEAHAWDAKAKAGEAANWWSGTPGGGSAKQLIGRYDGVTGAEVVNGIKQALPCGSVTYADGMYAVMADLALPKLAEWTPSMASAVVTTAVERSSAASCCSPAETGRPRSSPGQTDPSASSGRCSPPPRPRSRLPSASPEFSCRSGSAYETAVKATGNAAERALLQERRDALRDA